MAKKETSKTNETPQSARPGDEAKPAALPAFSLLASGLHFAAKVEKRVASEAFEAPSETVTAAWAEICSPARVALMVVGEGVEFFATPLRHYNQKAPALIAPGYTAEALSAISAGIDELSQEINALAASKAFQTAGSEFGPMLASPSPKGPLCYPLLGAGIKTVVSAIEGVKLPTLSGGPIASVASHALYPSANVSQLIKSLGEQAKEEIKDNPKLEELIKAADKQISAFHKAKGYVQNASAWDPAPVGGHVTVGTLGRASYLGEVPLPSIAGMSQELAALKKSPRIELPLIKSSRYDSGGQRESIARQMLDAVQITRQGALGAISAAMAPSPGAFNLTHRELNFGLSLSPLAPAALALKKGDETLEANLRAGEAIYASIIELHPDVNRHDLRNNSGLAQWLSSNKDNSAQINAALERAYELGSEPIAQGSEALRREYYYYSHNRRTVREPIKMGEHGVGLAGTRAALLSAPARIGLARWALGAARALDRSEILYLPDPQQDEARLALMQSLKRFSNEIKNATFVFADAAMEAAAKTEATWLNEREFGDAWRQAATMGLPSQKSIAWAKQNPMGASLSSSDPIARMAGHTARALGIRAAEDADMAESLRAELKEFGLDEGGFALLTQSEKLRGFLTPLVSGLAGTTKPVAKANATAIPMACKAVSAGARLGMDGDEAALFAKALLFSTEATLSTPGAASAMGDAVAPIHAQGGEGAKLFIDLARARAANQGSLFEALARDWQQGRSIAQSLGVDEGESLKGMSERFNKFARAMPNALHVDWRADPFKDKAAWEIFGNESPRLKPVLSAAAAEGGLAARCAKWASAFEIKDAADANDLIGRGKQEVKKRFNLSEGAWKAAIKSPEALELLNERIEQPNYGWRRYDHGLQFKSEFMLSEEAQATLSGASSRHVGDDSPDPEAQRMGYGINLAIAQGVALPSALAALSVFKERPNSVALFSPSIDSRPVDSVEAADFYIKEEKAKSERMPKLFKEACKRFEKFESDRAQALARGDAEPPLPGRQALAAEVADLTDWISHSEYGVWQTLPKDPTWGQLCRLSRAWHDEMAAREADRLARERAKQKEQEMVNKLNPFAPRASEHWEPIIGKHARDGWEAVELTSQAQLSEEGSAMSHCVSSYSGYCRSGALRIFSIRLNGERKCTMEVRPKGHKALCETGEKAGFSITQNKGRHNAMVTNQATQKFCEETVEAVEASWAVKWRETQALIAAAKEKERLKQEKLKAERAAAKAESGESSPARPKA